MTNRRTGNNTNSNGNGNSNSNGKSEMRGFFAALRMTSEN